jgi:hypothetical protein
MGVRFAVTVSAAVTGAVVLSGCGSDDPSSAAPSKAEICGKALGVVVLSEVGDDALRRARRAKDTADVLSKLATETRDRSLSEALSAAAGEAREVTRRRLTDGGLRAWAAQEQERFNSLRDACA